MKILIYSIALLTLFLSCSTDEKDIPNDIDPIDIDTTIEIHIDKSRIFGKYATKIDAEKSFISSFTDFGFYPIENEDFMVGDFFGYPVFRYSTTGSINLENDTSRIPIKLKQYACYNCEAPPSPGGMKRYVNARLSGTGIWMPALDSIILDMVFVQTGHFKDSYKGLLHLKKVE